MSEKFKVSVDDVQAFLKTGGLKWDKTIVTKEGKVPAKRLNDLALKNNTPVDIRTIDRSNNPTSLNIAVSPIHFATYVSTFDYSDIDAVLDYIVEQDYSKEWINYLLSTYGKDYRDYVSKLCKHEKNLLVLNTHKKIEDLNARKKAVLKEHEENLNYYNNIEKMVYSNTDSFSINKK